MMGYGFGMFGIGMVLMVLFWVLVIAGGVWLVATLDRGIQAQPSSHMFIPPSAPVGQTPLNILKARYAKGEITKEQFEEMKRDLGQVLDFSPPI